MKHIKLILLLLILIPLKVLAYDYDNIFINATLESNGDLIVEQYMDMSGEYNGQTILLKYFNEDLMKFNPNLPMLGGSQLHNADDVTLIEIKGIEKDSNYNFSNTDGYTFKETNKASKGDYGVYQKRVDDDGYFYTIYNPTKKNKAIYLKYKLSNIAVVHNDVGELFWTVFTSGSSSIENVKITVHFPNNDEELKVWAHGSLHGKITPIENKSLVATISPQYSGSSLDIRATFSKNVLINSRKFSNTDALSKIMKYETEEKANNDYKNITRIESYLIDCKSYPSRYCYESLTGQVAEINDKEIKESYEKEMEELHKEVIKKEEERAELEVSLAESFKKYVYYQDAIEAVSILENENLKKEYLKRLDIVYEEVIIKETQANKIFTRIAIPFLIISIAILILIYFILDRDSKPSFKEHYLRELPEGYSPTALSYLLHKKITKEAISAEILLLINNGDIKVEKKPDDKEYTFKRKMSDTTDKTSKKEKILNFFFCYGNPVKLSEIKKGSKKSPSKISSRYDSLISSCKSENKKMKLYSSDEQSKFFGSYISALIGIFIWFPFTILLPFIGTLILLLIFGFIISKEYKKYKDKITNREKIKVAITLFSTLTLITTIIISIIFLCTNSVIRTCNKLFLFTILISIFNLFYTCMCTNRTKKGSTDYRRWMAVKRFLNDFGKMDDKELPEVALWREYLAYSIVLGCSKKLAKTMAIKVPEFSEEGMIDFNYTTTIINDISRSVSNSVSSATSYSPSSGGSSFSGSSGGGGGFSSSSGSSGGGGGGSSVGRF